VLVRLVPVSALVLIALIPLSSPLTARANDSVTERVFETRETPPAKGVQRVTFGVPWTYQCKPQGANLPCRAVLEDDPVPIPVVLYRLVPSQLIVVRSRSAVANGNTYYRVSKRNPAHEAVILRVVIQKNRRISRAETPAVLRVTTSGAVRTIFLEPR
jgi:hypothetical protein